jgi:hypothetical protein
MAKSGNGNRKGGCIGSKVNVEKGVRVGTRAREMNPRGVSQIGSSLGNHPTDGGGKALRSVEPVRRQLAPAGQPGGVPLGNEVACNVRGGGPGRGRNLWGQSGSQKQWGAANPGGPRIANTKGEWPD